MTCFGLKRKASVPLSVDFWPKKLISSVSWHNMSSRRQSSLSETADVLNGSKKKIAARYHEARKHVIPPLRGLIQLIETILDPTYVRRRCVWE